MKVIFIMSCGNCPYCKQSKMYCKREKKQIPIEVYQEIGGIANFCTLLNMSNKESVVLVLNENKGRKS